MSETGDRRPAPKQRAQQGLHAKVIEVASQLPKGTALDVPAGEGALSAELAKLGYRVTAGDVACDLVVEDVPFTQLNLDSDLPFHTESFDGVFCIEGVEHTENPYHTIRELARVLKPGARLVLSTPNVLCLRSRLRFLLTSHHRRFKDINLHGHLTPLSYRELKFAFECAGLAIERIETNWYRGKWGILYPLLRAIVRLYTKRHHPLGSELTTREMLDGQILILAGRKLSNKELAARPKLKRMAYTK
jgi:SAM-dependent methyltransferase